MDRKLVLTPECQDLWLLSPSIIFDYQKIIIDENDYNNIVFNKDDSALNCEKAYMLEKLNKFKILELKPYKKYFDDNTKKNIHEKAEKFIENLIIQIKSNLIKSNFYKLSIFTHFEYAKYLKNSIMAWDIVNSCG